MVAPGAVAAEAMACRLLKFSGGGGGRPQLLQEPLERPTEGADWRGGLVMAADVIVVHTCMYILELLP